MIEDPRIFAFLAFAVGLLLFLVFHIKERFTRTGDKNPYKVTNYSYEGDRQDQS